MLWLMKVPQFQGLQSLLGSNSMEPAQK
ncbi:hypothetical protein Goshw_008285 [Gossypium schwendimanii]|uniref:Uncharacterized protein n=1 Tax=Gossypium schwendimanii TaxID=34291 RepID=A0A7J9KK76_GOSSC|nr:hypothetical protein [Gossypium schwendimanii]